MNLWEDTYLPELLHSIAQGLLVPTAIVIIALIVASIFIIGQVITEFFTERRHFKQNMPGIINQINDSDYEKLASILEKSSFLR
ncbi:MAG: hypothetical protein LBJ48_05960, partial [Coriobacteriales bacterium]|nr:hypothetical protein [Coriobacteriales bacterium]